MRVALVVAAAENGVIGSGGGLAWRISDDLKWFKRATLGKPIVMGRKTFDSIGRALPGRANIVVTRSPSFTASGVLRAATVDEALAIAAQEAGKAGAEEICIIGGGEIYRQTINLADRIYLTRVAARVDGDTRFPRIDRDEWREMAAGGCEANDKNQYSCRFFILDRIASQRKTAKADAAKSS
ncbi:MAG: dihydrofolate reductase [Pseudomonadota bacterium]|nr:dihydrofolate reductase [Pseudomonadota bacterium]